MRLMKKNIYPGVQKKRSPEILFWFFKWGHHKAITNIIGENYNTGANILENLDEMGKQ